MNNKGIATIELITSFIIASIVFILLFNLILSIKDVYADNALKTSLLIKQANLSRDLNKEINSSKKILSVHTWIENDNKLIYEFTFNDDENIITKDLVITEDRISFDDLTYELKNGISSKGLDNDYISYKHLNNTYNILIIDIPIESSSLVGNYGVKVIYRYNINTDPIDYTDTIPFIGI